MNKTIYFDMDGTLVDFYNVKNWLNYLINKNTYPYEKALPLINNIQSFETIILLLKNKGYKIGIISWCSKGGDIKYNRQTRKAKKDWLKKYFSSIKFDTIHIIKYGTNKNKFNIGNDILFDDEQKNRDSWSGDAYSEKEIFTILNQLLEVKNE